MKLLSSFPLALMLCVSVLLGGCFIVEPRPPMPPRTPEYYRVVTSDFEGRRIAEYVAEGKVAKSENGFRFWAVQRNIFEPKPMEFRYPLGRPVTAEASNVIVTPTGKPLWLVALDGQAPTIQETIMVHPTECPPGH